MREHFDAMGSVAGAVIAAGDDITGTIRTSQDVDLELGFQVGKNGTTIVIGGQTHQEHMMVMCDRRLTFANHDFNFGENAHINDANEVVSELVNQNPAFDGLAQTNSKEIDNVDYFDGVAYLKKLYPAL